MTVKDTQLPQEELENKAFEFGGGGQVAPASRLVDFCTNKSFRNNTKLLYSAYQIPMIS
mgnify:CR=1 FL=1